MKATFLWRRGGHLNGGDWNHFARTALIGGFATRPFSGSARLYPLLRQMVRYRVEREERSNAIRTRASAHGHQTLEDETKMYYMTSQFYAPDAVRGVRYDDPAFNIRWLDRNHRMGTGSQLAA